MSCIKSTMESYQIRKDHEYANISLRCWDNPPPADSSRGMYYGGEIMIHSSFGSWAYSWNACGSPFKRFLLGAGFDYIFGKFMGHALERFDGEASFRQVLAKVIECRRRRELNKAEARTAWDSLDDVRSQAECSEEGFCRAIGSAQEDLGLSFNTSGVKQFAKHELSEPWYMTIKKDDPSATRFWRILWPEFQAALRAELTQPAEAVPA